ARKEAYRLHGGSLLPLISNEKEKIRDLAFGGRFAEAIMVTDGEWVLFRWPVDRSNQPLVWCGRRDPGWLHRDGVVKQVGPDRFEVNKPVLTACGAFTNELFNLKTDYCQQHNVYHRFPDVVNRLERGLKKWLVEVGAPEEQLIRLGL
ncbi:MAG: hypothetical protein M1489_01010, partial [Firmicutes bacterium]|nr:hypothetical protein [Bacillota bacterium]